MENIKVFIDDYRHPSSKHDTNEGWVVCRSYEEFEKLIDDLLEKKEQWISEISFDYALGNWNYNGSDCFKLLARTIKKYGLPIPDKIYVHSEYGNNCIAYFKSTATSLSLTYDVDVDLIVIGLFGKSRNIVKPFD